jgi:superfamily II DNA/RNA helicase
VYQFTRKVLASFKSVKPVTEDLKALRQTISSITVGLNIGGLPLDDDKKNYHERGFIITIGTVGRVYELVYKNILKLDCVRMVILDEGDKLFEQSDTVKRMKVILKEITGAQILVYSATYSDKTFEELSKYGLFTYVRTIASGNEMKVRITDSYGADDLQEDKEILSLSNIVKLKCLF